MEKKSSKVLVTLGPGGWGPAAGGDGLRSKTPCPRCYFAISPLSASRDVKTNVWTRRAEHRTALRPFYSFSHFLAMQDEAQHSSLALGVCPSCSRMCLHCAFGEDPKKLHPVPGRCNPLGCTFKS